MLIRRSILFFAAVAGLFGCKTTDSSLNGSTPSTTTSPASEPTSETSPLSLPKKILIMM